MERAFIGYQKHIIAETEQAVHIIANGDADAVFLARAMLCNPRWALMATEIIGRCRWIVGGPASLMKFHLLSI